MKRDKMDGWKTQNTDGKVKVRYVGKRSTMGDNAK